MTVRMLESVILFSVALFGAPLALGQTSTRQMLAGCSMPSRDLEWACYVWQVGQTTTLWTGRQGKVLAPVPLYTPEPDSSALNSAAGGKLRFIVILNKSGRIAEIKAADQRDGAKSVGLEEQAVDTLRRWRFEPAMLYGLPVPVQFTIEFTFAIHKPSQNEPSDSQRAYVTHSFSYDHARMQQPSNPKIR